MGFGSTARLRIRFESRRALEDGFTEILPCLADRLHEPILPVVGAPSNEVIDILLVFTQQPPDFRNWITSEASRELSKPLLAGDEVSINLSEEFR